MPLTGNRYLDKIMSIGCLSKLCLNSYNYWKYVNSLPDLLCSTKKLFVK